MSVQCTALGLTVIGFALAGFGAGLAAFGLYMVYEMDLWHKKNRALTDHPGGTDNG